MNTTNNNEQAFEALIEKALVGSSREERGNANVDSQTPDSSQFYWGLPGDMDKKLAIDTRRLWSFLNTSQKEELEKYKGESLQTAVPRQIAKQIETFGIVDVLRKGIDIENIHLTLFYPRPSKNDSEISHIKYAKNQFSVTRQQTFSLINAGWEIDMVIYINGLPLFTIELKRQTKGQTALKDGQEQYRSQERNPKDPLLNFGRCIAHFTFDEEEAYFATRLDGKDTYFMPFNKGQDNGQGAGNPANPNGYKTSYMWERIFTKDVISDIIQNYVLIDYGEAKTGKRVPHIMKNAKVMIFPRYHQFDVVSRLTADVSTMGVGKTYLIQHSAGSGKSNSITWLAFKLIKECPATMDAIRAKAIDKPLYDSVIVVTDRRILDRQISDNIKAFGNSNSIIQHADSSAELKAAIENGKRIIITTIQKFPFISSSIGNVNDHNFAIIIDEAHSSQSGTAADEMNATTQRADLVDADQQGCDTDKILMQIAKDRKMSSNCSYFAFTATPKKETLEKFGWEDAEGHFHPFHLYSMKQAIEEGFILDVLTNYTTYKSYYELIKAIEDNPEYDKDKAQKLLKTAVERDPRTIRAKAEIMLEHFDSNVFRAHKLKSKGKAMVLTQSIECAIEYYNALCAIKEERKLPYGILIAFSGERELDGETFSETKLNGFPDKNTPEEFNKDENRILVVANKYLTGFDQPKLCAMYIDKRLQDVLAVQALSRLNRSANSLGKTSQDIFVLDFFNTKEDMKAYFDPFYTVTLLDHATDVNVLHELRITLLQMGVYEQEDVEAYIVALIYGRDVEMQSIIDKVADIYNNVIDWQDNGKADFKIKCKQFVKIYSRMAPIINYENLEWEKLYWFLRHLIPYLVVPHISDSDLRDLLENVDLNTYGLRRTALHEKIILDAGETVLDTDDPKMAGAGDLDSDVDTLEQIIIDFNERWFQGWKTTPEDQKATLITLVNAVVNDPDYNNLIVGNPDTEAVEIAFNNIIDRVIRRQRSADMSLYKEYQQNEGFKDNFRVLINRMINEGISSHL
ncbi:MAG: DEAD/DEAH box helicase family protein [Bacteroidales bacterium]|nr:DEAD/DEAH box helicase family protein [Bacteroidales bacterium]